MITEEEFIPRKPKFKIYDPPMPPSAEREELPDMQAELMGGTPQAQVEEDPPRHDGTEGIQPSSAGEEDRRPPGPALPVCTAVQRWNGE